MYKIPNHAIGETITINRPNWRDPEVDGSPAAESGRFSNQDPSDIAKARVKQLASQDWENTKARLGLPHGRILNELTNAQISRTDELAGICAKSARAWENQAKEIDQVEEWRNHLPLEMEATAARLQRDNPKLSLSLQPDLQDAQRPVWALRVEAEDPKAGYVEAVYAEEVDGSESDLVVRSGHFINDSLDGGTGTQEISSDIAVVSDRAAGGVEVADFEATERALAHGCRPLNQGTAATDPHAYVETAWADLAEEERDHADQQAQRQQLAEYQASLQQQQATTQNPGQQGLS